MSRQEYNSGRSVVVVEPRVGSETIIATHNFADPTTWFGESVRVEDETASDSGDGLTWNLANTNVIDMLHGLVLNQARHKENETHGYQVIVKVDAVEQTQTSRYGSNEDYSVDYANGNIVFHATKSGSTVEVSYSYAQGSGYKVAPSAGKKIVIEHAESQFSKDVTFEDSIVFEVRMPAEILEGMQQLPPGTIAPAGTMIPVEQKVYETFDNIVDEAMGAFPEIPTIGGPRGSQNPRVGFPFRYGTVRELLSSGGMELWVRLGSDLEFGGERATATFYCTIEEEV